MKPLLADLAAKHFSDKGMFGPSDSWSANNYVDTYEAYFRDRTDDEMNFLEIGIGVRGDNWDAQIAHAENSEGGASLKMWQDYFTKAKIFALDINPAKQFDNDRVKTFVIDQGNSEQLSAFVESVSDIEFDIMIDDGSHRGDHQQISLEHLWPKLKSGGLYIIEDLNDHGHGERKAGRHGSMDVVTTRRLILEYYRSNKIITPNSFSQTTFFDEIEDITFHTPFPRFTFKMLIKEGIRTLLGRSKRGVSQTLYAKDSFRMLVLTKK